MKELGAGMRFRLNMNLQPAEFHRKWASELRFLQNTSNATPKAYVFAKLSTWIGESQLRSIRQSFHSLCSPLALAANKVMTMAESSMNLQISRKRDAAHKFIYDDRGFVNDYCDGWVRQECEGKEGYASYAVWYGPKHGANSAKVLLPSVSNKQTEIITIIRTIEFSYKNRVNKLKILSDSSYVISLYQKGLISIDNQRFGTYSNFELLRFWGFGKSDRASQRWKHWDVSC